VIKNPRSKLRGIGGRKEANQKNAASCGEYVPKEIQRAVVSVQVDSHALQRRYCRSCRGMSVITLFDGVASAVFDGLPTSASRELYEAVT
jgi:hypothetical protein